MNKTKSKTLNIYLDEAALDVLRALAETENRSISKQIKEQLEFYLEQKYSKTLNDFIKKN